MLGGWLFGIGWGVGGLCPGPAVVAATFGLPGPALAFMPSLVIGMKVSCTCRWLGRRVSVFPRLFRSVRPCLAITTSKIICRGVSRWYVSCAARRAGFVRDFPMVPLLLSIARCPLLLPDASFMFGCFSSLHQEPRRFFLFIPGDYDLTHPFPGRIWSDLQKDVYPI